MERLAAIAVNPHRTLLKVKGGARSSTVCAMAGRSDPTQVHIEMSEAKLLKGAAGGSSSPSFEATGHTRLFYPWEHQDSGDGGGSTAEVQRFISKTKKK